MKTIPLSVPYLRGNELKYLSECIKTNWVSSAGRFVCDLEAAVCRVVGAKSSVACVNGTSGLHIALYICGVNRGDEVIVPTLTFIAPVNAVRYLGAEPVFMDCDDHMNIDCLKLRDFCAKECEMTRHGLRNKKTKRIIKAVVPVHVFGNPCDMEEVMRIARSYRLKVVEDATESLGSYYTAGDYRNRFTGAIADVGVYSFNGNKIITAGAGGMIVTNDRRLAEKARYLTNQAKDDPVRYIHNEIGYNFRLSNLEAAVGLAQLEQLNGFIKIKKRNYETYKKMFGDAHGLRILGVPDGTAPTYWFYSLILEKRGSGPGKDRLIDHLQANGIQARPVWYLNHLQKPYRRCQAYKVEKAVWFWRRTVNLPCSVNLEKKEINKVVSVIAGYEGGFQG